MVMLYFQFLILRLHAKKSCTFVTKNQIQQSLGKNDYRLDQ